MSDEKKVHPPDPYIPPARKLPGMQVKVRQGLHANKVGECEMASRSGDAWVHFGDVSKPTGNIHGDEFVGGRINHCIRFTDLDIEVNGVWTPVLEAIK